MMHKYGPSVSLASLLEGPQSETLEGQPEILGMASNLKMGFNFPQTSEQHEKCGNLKPRCLARAFIKK